MALKSISQIAREWYETGRFVDLAAAQRAVVRHVDRLARGEPMPIPKGPAGLAKQLVADRGIQLDEAQRLVFGALAKNLPRPIAPRGDDETIEHARARAEKAEIENIKHGTREARLMADQMRREKFDPETIHRNVVALLVRHGLDHVDAQLIATDAVQKSKAFYNATTFENELAGSVQATLRARKANR